MSRRPTRPFPSRNGWIVSNCRWASAALTGLASSPDDHASSVRDRSYIGELHSGAAGQRLHCPAAYHQASSGIFGIPLVTFWNRDRWKAESRGSRGSADSKAGNRLECAQVHAPSPRHNLILRRRRRAELQELRLLRKEASTRAMIACLQFGTKERLPFGRTCREIAAYPGEGWSHCPVARPRAKPHRADL